ncbi:hypothetical protein HanRHA438_Chr00c30g0855021 [Helianthus annuus]|uniref:Uncharacterized protein n=1 Tax=Helianthus annuus TaxID=4232 RepID=A0A9K3JI27_HELAN|nr:hypothetical protein HanXRQr2_Chr03g0116531 [Helianthus annuus]KAJ0436496.1 hypothetical protein HanHA300_Chr16g0591451 [Helianthus annuus]KAJ0440674.1 hypothetical protein HanIR_Chr16g0789341 [Helianthus annuus]KAJ0458776.1 hypothetical protein HanHA89_Chr16g0641621 [Helianthus annuus]KAJ0598299.1 hypothetical protein HanHA89_Chr04g0164271 [Helianthus annuus]
MMISLKPTLREWQEHQTNLISILPRRIALHNHHQCRKTDPTSCSASLPVTVEQHIELNLSTESD